MAGQTAKESWSLRGDRRCSHLALLLAMALLGAEVRAEGPVPVSAKIEAARQELYKTYRAQLEQLAKECDEQGRTDAAERCRTWLPVRDPYKLYVFKPTARDAQNKVGEPQRRPEWEARFQQLRAVQAEGLFELALQALANHQPALAYELAAETLREDPEHNRAGHILRVSEERERPPKVSKTRSGWRIQSEHYVVTTDHSELAGRELAQKLEKLNHVWRQIFISYYCTEPEITRWFDGGAVTSHPSKQHQVVLFRDREQYNSRLKAAQPQIEVTLGIYFDTTRRSYFFVGEEQYDGTLYHEATHQLFQEMRPPAREVGRRNNFWLIEAIACYMESLVEHEDYFTVGGFEEGRVPAARHRLLEDSFYVPLAELSSLGMHDLQRDPRLPMIYSQSSGLAMFLMHSGGGRYRQPLVACLQSLYSGKANPTTLANLTGQSYEELDRRYREFMVANSETAAKNSHGADSTVP